MGFAEFAWILALTTHVAAAQTAPSRVDCIERLRSELAPPQFDTFRASEWELTWSEERRFWAASEVALEGFPELVPELEAWMQEGALSSNEGGVLSDALIRLRASVSDATLDTLLYRADGDREQGAGHGLPCAALVLASFEPRAHVDWLVECLSSTDLRTAEIAARILAGVDPRRATRELIARAEARCTVRVVGARNRPLPIPPASCRGMTFRRMDFALSIPPFERVRIELFRHEDASRALPLAMSWSFGPVERVDSPLPAAYDRRELVQELLSELAHDVVELPSGDVDRLTKASDPETISSELEPTLLARRDAWDVCLAELDARGLLDRELVGAPWPVRVDVFDHRGDSIRTLSEVEAAIRERLRR